MKSPLWFDLIYFWKEWGKGNYGITFPFLVGAISHINRSVPNRKLISKICTEIEKKPVAGYYCEVRWCGDLDEPVATMKPLGDLNRVVINDMLKAKGQVSVGFTSDLMGMFGLDCETADECIDKLMERIWPDVERGNFSKNHGLFTPYTEGDIKFIEDVAFVNHT